MSALNIPQGQNSVMYSLIFIVFIHSLGHFIEDTFRTYIIGQRFAKMYLQ